MEAILCDTREVTVRVLPGLWRLLFLAKFDSIRPTLASVIGVDGLVVGTFF